MTVALIVDVIGEVRLGLLRVDEKHCSASLYHGEYPQCMLVAAVVFDTSTARIDFGFNNYHIWFGATCVELPFPELLKIADFLKLEIPLRSEAVRLHAESERA